MIPYRKKFFAKQYSELTGWRAPEANMNLRSPLNIIKPYRVKSLADFNITPKYPECNLEPPWLPLLSPRPQFSHAPLNQNKKNSKASNDPQSLIYSVKKSKSNHRPNVHSVSTRSNESGGNFHSYKGSVEFSKQGVIGEYNLNEKVDSGQFQFSDEENSEEVQQKFSNDLNENSLTGCKERIIGAKNKISVNKDRVLGNQDRLLGNGKRTKGTKKNIGFKHVKNKSEGILEIKQSGGLYEPLLEKKGTKVGVGVGVEVEGESNKVIEGVRKTENLSLRKGRTTISVDFQGMNAKYAENEEIEYVPARTKDPLKKTENPEPKIADQDDQTRNSFKGSSQTRPSLKKLQVLRNNESSFEKIPNLTPRVASTIYPQPRTATEEGFLQRSVDYSQVNLSPIQEAPCKKETENPSSALSDEEFQFKNPEKKPKVQVPFGSQAQKAVQLEKKKTSVAMPDNKKQKSFSRKNSNIQIKPTNQDLKIETNAQNKPVEKSENSPSSQVRSQKSKQFSLKRNSKISIMKINIVPPTEETKNKPRIKRSSSLLSSKSIAYLNPVNKARRRSKRTSTVGHISFEDRSNNSPSFTLSSSVDRFINNYSMSLASMLSILLVNLKESMSDINKEVNKSRMEKQDFNTLSVIRKNKKMKSKAISKRMKIELSLIMKPEKKQPKLDSVQLIENIKKSIFSDGVKKDMIRYLKNRKSTLNANAVNKNMRKIITGRLKNNKSDLQYISQLEESEDSSDYEKCQSEFDSSSEDQGKNEGLLQPDYKKKNLVKFLSDLNSRPVSSPDTPSSAYNNKQIKIVQRELQDSDFDQPTEHNLYIYNENNCDISEELNKMTWYNSKNIQRFMFSSQIQHSYLTNKLQQDTNDSELNDYEEGLDLLNLEYRMLKKRFYDMRGLTDVETEETDYNLIMLNPDQFSKAETNKFEIEKVKKYLRHIKYLQNRPKICIHKPKIRTFSNLIK